MSLNITVGLLTDVDAEDEDLVQEEFQFLDEVNETLRERGLTEHHEPTSIPDGVKTWSATVSSEGLEDLLRLAIGLAEDNGEEPVDAFPHLVGAQCNYYLPVEMPEPLLFEIEEGEDDEDYEPEFDVDEEEDAGQDEDEIEEEDEEFLIGVGSSIRLKDELAKISEWVNLPLERFPIDYSGEGGAAEWDDIFNNLQEINPHCADCEGALKAMVNLYHACQLSEMHKMAVCVG